LFCALVAGACQSNTSPTTSTPTATAPPAAALPPVEPLLKKVATLDGAADSTADMRLTVEGADGKRAQLDFRLQRKYEPEQYSTFLTVSAPREETDKALLAVERPGKPTEVFTYLAGMKKLGRLSSSNLLSFRDHKVTVQELLGLELGAYRSTGGERITDGGEALLKYTLQAPPELALAYRQIIAYFRESDQTPARFELFDDRNKLQKTMRIEEVKKIEGRQTITRVSIIDHAQNRQSRLDTRSIKYDGKLAAKIFTEQNLIDWTSGASRRLLE
jgi:hypothetical protein